ncbi:MAG: magnesium and cobalt transport protein CorA [Bacteroidales bacterium]|jgi:magnesium transporter|nr:magnesium and cobalt transport protein CorA [Bacteroidales bacterium]MEE3407288.1 CorA family divalent cation transporter [Candidatus Cryptobacteroides sp.]SKC46458.1 magnesium transporter [Bacteroidales bacterium WCE2008]MBO7365336.1 magnesium and cobalt transport protein CorA [Bacteroidales bacterium]MBP5234681.1 magnesium and cobalt transport protein CorA [Bacteroidales bacterium]
MGGRAMVDIFYRINGQIKVSQSETDFAKLRREDVVWIDLFAPSGDEKRAVEAFLGTEIQSRATAEEIESSSRFKETDDAIFANTNFLLPGPDEYNMEAVSFTLIGSTLTTLRDVPLRSFTELQRKLVAVPRLFPGGYWVFVYILDQRVDLDADMIELMSKEIAQYSRRINQEEDINEEFLLDINQLQENTMLVRENIVDKQRLINNLMKSDKYPPELESRFNVLQQDISSLINHTNFSFERLEYLQDTVVGLINLEQNKIMKIFTLISLLLMPPTLVASFYGMNVELPLSGLSWAWIIIIAFMLLSLGVVLWAFKKRKML